MSPASPPSSPSPADTAQVGLRQIPAGVWVLGFVSMLMDISSEMIHSLLPLFMMSVLGASALTIGLIEGLAESTALIVKVFSGVLSDYLGRRKGLAVFGYALGAITKPLFALAPTIGVVLTARLLDRVGKGVRGAPGMRWLPISRRRRTGVPPSAFDSRSIPWVRLSVRS